LVPSARLTPRVISAITISICTCWLPPTESRLMTLGVRCWPSWLPSLPASLSVKNASATRSAASLDSRLGTVPRSTTDSPAISTVTSLRPSTRCSSRTIWARTAPTWMSIEACRRLALSQISTLVLPTPLAISWISLRAFTTKSRIAGSPTAIRLTEYEGFRSTVFPRSISSTGWITSSALVAVASVTTPWSLLAGGSSTTEARETSPDCAEYSESFSSDASPIPGASPSPSAALAATARTPMPRCLVFMVVPLPAFMIVPLLSA
jgi:hypothetical protein